METSYAPLPTPTSLCTLTRHPTLVANTMECNQLINHTHQHNTPPPNHKTLLVNNTVASAQEKVYIVVKYSQTLCVCIGHHTLCMEDTSLLHV